MSIDYEALWQSVLSREPKSKHPGQAFVEAYETAKASEHIQLGSKLNVSEQPDEIMDINDDDPVGDAHEKGYAEGYKARALVADADTSQQPDEFTLLGVLADIRQKTGVGDKPMLSELADTLAGLIKRESGDVRTLAARLSMAAHAVITFPDWSSDTDTVRGKHETHMQYTAALKEWQEAEDALQALLNTDIEDGETK